MIGPDLASTETPAGLVDLDRVRRNARKVADYCREHGLAWRPHVKTHKSLRLARIQLEAGARGLTVATPHEAEVMAAVCSDLLFAYPPVGTGRLRRLMALPERVDLTVALDTEVALRALGEAAARASRTVGVLVELDAGLRRVGVSKPDDAVTLARRAEELDRIEFRGLMFYPGHIRLPPEEQDAPLRKLGERLERFYEALRRAGLSPGEVSGGSTPTLWRSHELPGLTEVRAGTCIFHDRDTVAAGVAEAEEVAYSVLTTVVSDAVPDQVVVDAGSKALSTESFRSGDGGYGVLLDRPEVQVSRLSEEHGVLDLSSATWRPGVGDQVRIVPNHVCVSVNLQDRLLGLETDGRIETVELQARGRRGSHG